jgi:hypothetical protein
MRADAIASALREATAACAPAAGHDWLRERIAALTAAAAAEAALAAFTAAGRHVGRGALATPASVAGPDDEIALTGWCADELARAAILATVAAAAPGSLAGVVDAAYRDGDSREKQAVIRALALLPDGARFVDVALDAGRTNETPLFGALACDNPYPARHYPELELNKLVMKAAFVGAPLDRIVGLRRRANPELARMAMEYIDQQESAGRAFPPELWRAIAPHPPPGAVARMLGYASHAVAAHRAAALRALAEVAQPRTRSFLDERRALERDPEVAAALADALSAIDRNAKE